MAKNVIQKVVFRTTPENLYAIYMDAKKHAAAMGGPVAIGKKIGSRFQAFGGMLRGKILHVVPGKMVVQTWRSSGFYKGDRDSILVLNFSKVRGGARLDLAHIHVPDQDFKGITKGWPQYYWKPLAQYLKKKTKVR